MQRNNRRLIFYFIRPQPKAKDFEMFGESDERFKIAGGNQQLVDPFRAITQHSFKL